MSRARQMLKELKAMFTNQKCIKKIKLGSVRFLLTKAAFFFKYKGKKL